MATNTINLLELSDSEQEKITNEIRELLRQQVSEDQSLKDYAKQHKSELQGSKWERFKSVLTFKVN